MRKLGYAAGTVLFLGWIIVVPSISRYQFESAVMSQFESAKWMRFVNKTKWGAISEPLTWLNAPIGSFYIVGPSDPIQPWVFSEYILRHEEEAYVRRVEAICDDNSILRYQSAEDGTFSLVIQDSYAISPADFETFCEYDWSNEQEALRQAWLDEQSKIQEQSSQ